MNYYFIDDFNDICRQKEGINKDFAEVIDLVDLIDDINKLAEENMKLKSENNMLKVTIGRNEAYINRLTHTSKWR